MREVYKKWKHRTPPVFYEILELMVREEVKNDAKDMDVNDVTKLTNVDKDALEAMISLG